jgi:AcrR family transcriptional regulator
MTDAPFSGVFKAGKDGRQPTFKTAAGIFARKGYHGTTVDEIAQAVGVAKGTIYYHFKNKEDLYFAVIQEGINIFGKQLRDAAAAADSPHDKIRNLVDSHLDFYEKEQDLVFLFLKELTGSELRRKILAGMLAECLAVVREAITAGIKDGSFRSVNPELATSSLFGMITIAAFHYLAFTRPIARAAVKSAVEEIFTRGILPAKEKGDCCCVAGNL